MKWLPEVWSRTKPCCSRKRMIWRGLIAGSLGVITTRYTNCETYKTSSNGRGCEEVENSNKSPDSSELRSELQCVERIRKVTGRQRAYSKSSEASSVSSSVGTGSLCLRRLAM